MNGQDWIFKYDFDEANGYELRVTLNLAQGIGMNLSFQDMYPPLPLLILLEFNFRRPSRPPFIAPPHPPPPAPQPRPSTSISPLRRPPNALFNPYPKSKPKMHPPPKQRYLGTNKKKTPVPYTSKFKPLRLVYYRYRGAFQQNLDPTKPDVQNPVSFA
jgi:hypothetical protein